MDANGRETITLLFTDIEGSTRHWENNPDAMRIALAKHDAILHDSVDSNNGVVFKTMGDQFCAAFISASDALGAALHAQIALTGAEDPAIPLRVRMALHTGCVDRVKGDFFGPALNRIARLLEIGHGRQILCTAVTKSLIDISPPAECSFRDLALHRLRDLQDPEHVYQVLHKTLPNDFPPLRSLQAFANNLPHALTTFIGRERELAEIRLLLGRKRLLTLTGAGGCGKSRLAIHVAADVLEDYPDGVWLVELAALTDASLVPQAVASTLGVREEPDVSILQTLSRALNARRLLLILDNCEHLVGACAETAETLLRTCARVAILATSRQALAVPGEQAYYVPSLSLPPENSPSLEAAGASESLRLFEERARLVWPDFSLAPNNLRAVAKLCRSLDGIPLAIELAAARVKALTVDQIARRLDDRFHLLTGGSDTELPRHRTLRALIDWSYDLLSLPERNLLDRLSIFNGGWSLEAAEAICAGDGVEQSEVIDLITSLVDKSLVIYEGGQSEPRYRMLETVRQYCNERLSESGEILLRRQRHRDWFLQLAESAEPRLRGPAQTEWLRRLEREHDNLRIALDCCQRPGLDAESGLRLAAALGWFWYVRGYLTEGRGYLRCALSYPGAEKPSVGRARGLASAGVLAWRQGDFEAARSHCEQGLAILSHLDDVRTRSYLLITLGLISIDQGKFEKSLSQHEAALAAARGTGDDWATGIALDNLGLISAAQGDYAGARVQHEQSLTLREKIQDRWGIAHSLHHLGLVAQAEGDYIAALRYHARSLTLNQEVGGWMGVANSVEALASLSFARGLARHAVRLWSAAQAFRNALGLPRRPGQRGKYDREIAAARDKVGTEVFDRIWDEASAWSLQQTVEYGLTGADCNTEQGRASAENPPPPLRAESIPERR